MCFLEQGTAVACSTLLLLLCALGACAQSEAPPPEGGPPEGPPAETAVFEETVPPVEAAMAREAGRASGHDGLVSKPNILVIVADDLGYSDLGAFGGEIATPNLDRLARSGIRLTDFHTAAMCSPTRAMLLTGTDHHLAGLGSMAETLAPYQWRQPGYEGHLNARVVSIASVLREAGYHTYMAGKWHLGLEEDQSPAAQGFERSYVLLEGAANHFNRRSSDSIVPDPTYRENGRVVQRPEGVYSTVLWTDKIIRLIDRHHGDGRPFFAYLAYTAPHWPLQAPPVDIARYRGRYENGFEAVRAERFDRMRELGIVPEDMRLPPWPAGVPVWEDLTPAERRISARAMEVYAAMVERMDREIGRILQYLRGLDELERTVIVFFSDNGAEGYRRFDRVENLLERLFSGSERSFDEWLGTEKSFAAYGPEWASVSNVPLRLFKAFPTEGGIRVPCIVTGAGVAGRGITRPGTAGPASKGSGWISHAFTSVMDLAPTFLELAGLEPTPGTETTVSTETTAAGAAAAAADMTAVGDPPTVKDAPAAAALPSARWDERETPMMGRSLVPLLRGEADSVHPDSHVMGWELFSRRAVRQGRWKVVWMEEPAGSGDWQLYDLSLDLAEQHDLSLSHPEKCQELIEEWKQYAEEVGVVLPEGLR
jgi:arylsulfatase